MTLTFNDLSLQWLLGTSGTNVFLSPHLYSDGVVETNMDAVAGGGEMYAEVDEMKRIKMEASAAAAEGQRGNPLAALGFVNSQ